MQPRRRRAFTLIETLAVIALLAVLTAAAAVSLSAARRAASVEDAAGQFVAFDRSTREVARRFGRTPTLRFDLNRGTAVRVNDGAADGREAEPSPFVAGGAGVRVTRVAVAGGEIVSYGEVAVPLSADGRSPSYAVLLTGREGQWRWVGFAGLTGQPLVLRDEQDVRDILCPAGVASAAPPRADAR